MLHQAELTARRYSGHGSALAASVRQPAAARRLGDGVGVVHRLPGIAHHAARATRCCTASATRSSGASSRRSGVTGVHTGPMKRAGGIRGREYTPTIDGNFDRISTEIDPWLRHRGRIQGDGPARARQRRRRHRRHHSRPQRQGGRLPARRARLSATTRASITWWRSSRKTGACSRPCRPARTRSTSSPTVGRPAQGARLHRRAAPADHLLREERQGDRLVGHRRRRRRRRQEAPLGLPPLLQGGAAHLQLARSRLRRAASRHRGRAPLPGHAGRTHAATRRQWLPRYRDRCRQRAAPGPRGIRCRSRPTSSSPAWCASSAASRSRSSTSPSRTSRPCRRAAPISPTTSSRARPTITPSSPAMPSSCVSCSALQKTYQIDPAGLIHALQNHDELTLELVHFWTRHKDDTFTFRGKKMKGSELREIIRDEMHSSPHRPAAPYNLEAANGVSCTTATVIAAALGIRDVSRLTDAERRDIQRAHLLLAMYNAMQPGVFALSGWDLVGALTLPAESVKTLLADGDTRWINRGAYDLLGDDSGAVEVERRPATRPGALRLAARAAQALGVVRLAAEEDAAGPRRVPHQRERADRRPGGEGPRTARHGPSAARRQRASRSPRSTSAARPFGRR